MESNKTPGMTVMHSTALMQWPPDHQLLEEKKMQPQQNWEHTKPPRESDQHMEIVYLDSFYASCGKNAHMRC